MLLRVLSNQWACTKNLVCSPQLKAGVLWAPFQPPPRCPCQPEWAALPPASHRNVCASCLLHAFLYLPTGLWAPAGQGPCIIRLCVPWVSLRWQHRAVLTETCRMRKCTPGRGEAGTSVAARSVSPDSDSYLRLCGRAAAKVPTCCLRPLPRWLSPWPFLPFQKVESKDREEKRLIRTPQTNLNRISARRVRSSRNYVSRLAEAVWGEPTSLSGTGSAIWGGTDSSGQRAERAPSLWEVMMSPRKLWEGRICHSFLLFPLYLYLYLHLLIWWGLFQW